MDAKKPAALLPSSTVLLVRDGTAGLEVFMVKRHHAIDFASGAMVFPGGKLCAGDRDPVLSERHARPGRFAADLTPFAFAAIREAFEETGLLLARRKGGERLLGAADVEVLQRWREPLNREEKSLAEMAEVEGLEYALDVLAPFAHWITPEAMPKRFDTWFFLAAAPEGQIGMHDGSESVDSAWLGAQQALDDWEAKRRTIVFATRMQLVKLARAKAVAAALAAAEREPVIDVLPVLDKNAPGEPHLRIPAEAGYGVTEVPLSRIGM
jgi:8-oxo-dGTP pyrophosphatase MutT (NUDIX family)